MSEKQIEIKTEATQEKKIVNTEETRRDSGTGQGVGVNPPSSSLAPMELEYALARPV